MTAQEKNTLRAMKLVTGPVSWPWLRNQLGLSEGALQVVLNSLKRHLLIEQAGRYYRLTSLGREALSPPTARAPFEGGKEW